MAATQKILFIQSLRYSYYCNNSEAILSGNIQSLLRVSDIILLYLKHLYRQLKQKSCHYEGEDFVKIFEHLVWAKPGGVFVSQKEKIKRTQTVTVLWIVWIVSHMSVMWFAWVCVGFTHNKHSLIHSDLTSSENDVTFHDLLLTCSHSWVPGQTMLDLWPFNNRKCDYSIPKMVEINRINK